MSDQFGKTIRAQAGGAQLAVSISSAPRPLGTSLPCKVRRLGGCTGKLARSNRQGGRELAGGDGGRRAGNAECPGDRWLCR